MEAVTQFLSDYRTPIYITLGVVVIVLVLFLTMRTPSYVPVPSYMIPRGMVEGVSPHNEKPEPVQPEAFTSETKEPVRVILFYAKWCPHCKTFMDGSDSVWEQLKKKMADRPGLIFEEADGDEKTEMATTFGVEGFPTIIKLDPRNKGNVVVFKKERTLEALEEFLK